MGRRGTDLAVSVTLTPEREGGADGVESLVGSEAADGNGPYSLMPDGEGGRRWGGECQSARRCPGAGAVLICSLLVSSRTPRDPNVI